MCHVEGGYGTVGTAIAAGLRSYDAEDHQQYLAKNPHGYRCHANTGVPVPEDRERTAAPPLLIGRPA